MDEDIAVFSDVPLSYRCKAVVDPLGGCLPKMGYNTILKFSSFGISLHIPQSEEKMGLSHPKEVGFWVYHDLIDWSVLRKDKKVSFKFSTFEDGVGSRKLDFVVRTREASSMAASLDCYVEKYMAHVEIVAEMKVRKEVMTNSATAVQKDLHKSRDTFSKLSSKQKIWNSYRLYEFMISKEGQILS